MTSTTKNKQSLSCELIGHRAQAQADTAQKVVLNRTKKTLRTGSVSQDLL